MLSVGALVRPMVLWNWVWDERDGDGPEKDLLALWIWVPVVVVRGGLEADFLVLRLLGRKGLRLV